MTSPTSRSPRRTKRTEATLPRYRKKPVEIEAFRFRPGMALDEFPDWAKDAAAKQMIEGGPFFIDTLEGTMLAHDGDWIIKGVKGELYPCKPDVFAATYEEVEDA